ncbi:histidine-type phosphatase [Paracidovorax avenae]
MSTARFPLRQAVSALLLALTLAACGGGGGGSLATGPSSGAYATKTAYQPRQSADSYEAPPPGFSKVYAELVARHGSRGLSSLKYDDAVLNLWARAQADGALTPLGRQLGPDVEKIMRANFLLGWGVDGIGTPGYGNLTQVGIAEHRQLAVRLAQRDAELFSGQSFQGRPRQVEVLHSGQDRAVDSSQFFAASLAAAAPAVAGAIVPAVVDRYQLYPHKLSATGDAVSDGSAVHAAVLAASLDYQRYAAGKDAAGYGAEAAAKVAAARAAPEVRAHARAVLERLFTAAFIDRLDAGSYSVSNNGTHTFASADGRFTSTLTGDGKTKIQGIVDAAALLYELYIIAPGMRQETGGVDFGAYMPAEHAPTFAYLQDIDDFYGKGPAATEYGGVTTRFTQALLQDFFDEVGRIAQGQMGRVARLRFTHAEVMIPFAALLGLRNASTPVPRAQTYAYPGNPWRGEDVSPMATNVQWDVVRDAGGKVLVKMLFNEQEVDFPAACEGARHAGGSRYYEYGGLRRCYGL